MEHREMPIFTSDIPKHLLQDADEQRQWIMNELSIGNQRMQWLAHETTHQSRTLQRVEELAKKTNGRVSTLEENEKTTIQKLDNSIKKSNSQDKVLKPLNTAYRILSNKTIMKIVGVFFIIFCFGLMYIYNTYHLNIKAFVDNSITDALSP